MARMRLEMERSLAASNQQREVSQRLHERSLRLTKMRGQAEKRLMECSVIHNRISLLQEQIRSTQEELKSYEEDQQTLAATLAAQQEALHTRADEMHQARTTLNQTVRHQNQLQREQAIQPLIQTHDRQLQECNRIDQQITETTDEARRQQLLIARERIFRAEQTTRETLERMGHQPNPANIPSGANYFGR